MNSSSPIFYVLLRSLNWDDPGDTFIYAVDNRDHAESLCRFLQIRFHNDEGDYRHFTSLEVPQSNIITNLAAQHVMKDLQWCADEPNSEKRRCRCVQRGIDKHVVEWHIACREAMAGLADGPENRSKNMTQEDAPPPAGELSERQTQIYRAVMAAGLLDNWTELHYYYPTSINQTERREQEADLFRYVAEALSPAGLKAVADMRSQVEFQTGRVGALAAIVTMWITDEEHIQLEQLKHDAMDWFRACKADCLEPLLRRLQDVAIYDCRTPHPEGDNDYMSPRRSVHMLDKYTLILQRIVQADMDSPCGFSSHPLLKLVVNLENRIDTCFHNLGDVAGKGEAKEAFEWMCTTLRDGDVDEFQAVPEYTSRMLSRIRAFIEDAYLRLGRGSFQLTWAEEMSLDTFDKAADEHRHTVKRMWAGAVKIIEAGAAKRRLADPCSAAITRRTKELLTETEKDILKALGTSRMTGQEIADKTRSKLNGHLKGVLSNMVKRNLLVKISDRSGAGYQQSHPH